MIDAVDHLKQRSDLSAIVGGKVRTDSGSKVGGLADVEHRSGGVSEQVHTGTAGQIVGQVQLRGLGVPVDRRKFKQIVEAEDPETRRPLQQEMQQVGRRSYVVESAVGRLVSEPEMCREGAKSAIGYFGPHESTGESARVDDPVGESGVVVCCQRTVEKAQVETYVVPDNHGVANEVEKSSKDILDAWCREHHRLRDTGEVHDLRRNSCSRVDEGLKRTGTLTTLVAGGGDLGDAA